MHLKDVSLVAEPMMISSESNMQNSTSLINMLMWDILNPDADYVENTSISEVSFVMKQESEESAISSRTRAQLCNLIIKNVKTVSDKRKHDCNVMKALSASLSLFKSDSQSIQSLKWFKHVEISLSSHTH